ncbi:molybdopterin molybdotransferase MoeA [uncultured Hymenobacter sp.]|uniref:molybdopterin molybdotransferase MoeA n=1 Tax=uncultured Hymenobacter sp. TaxID=170016 RepID=UPI0035CA7523
MLSAHDAFALVLATARRLPPETRPLLAAAGRVLAQDLRADRDFPPFHRVAMDGIAVAHRAWAGGQTTFTVAHTQYAGAPALPLADLATAAEVMTGAVLPPGADTVVRYEDLDLDEAARQATIRIPAPPRPGQHVHPQAQDRRQADLLLPAGTRLGPAEMAVAAAIGAAEIRVLGPARVALVSTGDELVDVAATPLSHQIRRSNVYALHALLTAAGAACTLHHFPDDPGQLHSGLAPLFAPGAYDAVVLSGAVSKGRADHLPGIFRELGVEEIFHEVEQRPGKPMWFGQKKDGGPAVFGLPGNPVSTLLTAYRYVRPWLRASQQFPTPPGPAKASEASWLAELCAPAVLAADVDFRPRLTYFLPVRLEIDAAGRRLAYPAPTGGSGDLAGLLGAQGFVELPPEPTHFAAGEVWPCWML